MEIGTCPRCATPYTSSEVTGFGILRGRSARQGGPRVEYACQACGARIHLVAHGEGRYAPPGQPPPAVVPEAERQPPWMREGAPDPRRAAPPPRSEPPPRADAPPEPDPGPDPEPLRVEVPEAEEPLGPADALALLGVEPTADHDTIERAFRERSLTCHPDKVAHLDPEFQELAERKFRRLQRAFDLLTN